jgi:uncharacterized protein (TIGR01777 family)
LSNWPPHIISGIYIRNKLILGVNMKVLVTGASGFVGKNLCKRLYDLGHEVHVLSTNVALAAINLGSNYKLFNWNNKDLPPAEAFEGVESVIHLAGYNIATNWSEENKKKIYDSRILSTKILGEAIKEYKPNLKSFVSTSAVGIYGDRPEGEVTEEEQNLANDFLGNVCKDWEAKVWEYKDVLPRTAILRVGVVLGKGGGALQKMLLPFKLGVGGPVGFGKQVMSWIHMDDLVNLYIEAATNEKYEGIVNAVSPNPKTNKEFSKTLGKVLGRPAFMPVPTPVLELALGEMSQIVIDGQKVIPTVAQKNGFNYQYAELAPALKSLNL